MPEPSDTPSGTVVVVTWQGAHLLPACLDSLRAQTVAHRLLVVDNASTDGTAALLGKEYPEAEVVRLERNLGFAGGVQAGLDRVRTAYAALLNNDAVADPGWLAALLRALEGDRTLGAVTSKMLLAGPDQAAINNAGVRLLPDGYGADIGLGEPDGPPFRACREVFGFSGGAAGLRVSAVREVGGFPTEFFMYYEDTDTSWRLRLAGWPVAYVPDAVVHHAHSATADQGSAMFAFHNERNRLLMLTRCAPAGLAWRQVLRFPVTTASLAVKRLLRRGIPRVHQFRVGLRLRVFGSYLAMLPRALRARRAIGRWAVVRRGALAADWLGPAGPREGNRPTQV